MKKAKQIQEGSGITLEAPTPCGAASPEALEKKIRQLEQSNDLLQEFASVAAHDLKAPLRKILIYAGKLQAGERLTARGEMQLDKIIRSAERMKQLLSDIHQYAALPHFDNLRQHCSLQELFDNVYNTLEVSISEKEAQVQTEGPLPYACVIPYQMELLFQNLLTNALKFTRPGIAPVVAIRHCFVEDSAAFPSDQGVTRTLQIQIRDNGTGFAQEQAAVIFAPFRRLHGAGYEGSGLGLAICRRITDNHHGRLSVVSYEGQGTTFTIELPA